MNILNITPWKNAWIDEWTQFWTDHKHVPGWIIGQPTNYELMKNVYWADVILMHWANEQAIYISNNLPKGKRLFIVARSYEINSSYGRGKLLPAINWKNVEKVFLLNESMKHFFEQVVKGKEVAFFRNGLNIEQWDVPHETKDPTKIAFVCDLSERKGINMAVQAMHTIRKVIPNAEMHHIGRTEDFRCVSYLQNTMSRLNMPFVCHGYKCDKEFVYDFLKDKKFILSSSVVEGNPMNILEAMASGVIPLVHGWPGAHDQFPEKVVWDTMDQLHDIVSKIMNPGVLYFEGEDARNWAVENFDYRKTFIPVLKAINPQDLAV